MTTIYTKEIRQDMITFIRTNKTILKEIDKKLKAIEISLNHIGSFIKSNLNE